MGIWWWDQNSSNHLLMVASDGVVMRWYLLMGPISDMIPTPLPSHYHPTTKVQSLDSSSGSHHPMEVRHTSLQSKFT